MIVTVTIRPSSSFFFFRSASSAFPDIGSVGRVEEKKKKKPEKKEAWYPNIIALEPENEPKINMAEKLVDVFVK